VQYQRYNRTQDQDSRLTTYGVQEIFFNRKLKNTLLTEISSINHHSLKKGTPIFGPRDYYSPLFFPPRSLARSPRPGCKGLCFIYAPHSELNFNKCPANMWSMCFPGNFCRQFLCLTVRRRLVLGFGIGFGLVKGFRTISVDHCRR